MLEVKFYDTVNDIYTFENRCIQNPELGLGDDTTKIILNTKGTIMCEKSGLKLKK